MEWAFTNLRRAHVDSSFLKNSASSNRKEYLKADWHSKSVLVEITRFKAHRTRQSSAWLRCQRPDAEQWLFLWLQLCLHRGICLGGGFGWLDTSRLCAKSPSCNDASGQRSDKRGKEPAISYLQHPGGTEVPGACPPPPQHPVGIGRPASCTLHSLVLGIHTANKAPLEGELLVVVAASASPSWQQQRGVESNAESCPISCFAWAVF